jgi:2-keto-3-deoxy-L-rhamnonate aldolase RhmA
VTEGMLRNNVKQSLAAGGYAFGTIVTYVRNPSLMRIIAASGFDFAFIDLQHSSFGWEMLADMCDTARAAGLIPLVRPYDHSPLLTNRIQDVGAMGVIHFDITERSQVDVLVDAIRYPPLGNRGSTALNSATMDYRSGPGSEVKAFITDNTMLVIQIESAEAVENLDRILDGGGVDVVEVGRADLSTSYGVPMDIRHPRVLTALDAVVAACGRHGVAPGAGCYSDEDAADMIRRGMRWLTFSTDRQILTSGYASGNKLLRSLVERHKDASRVTAGSTTL